MSDTAPDPDLGFVHRYACGVAGAPAVLLLHGTGGDENDLVPLAKAVAPGSCLLSPRGKVSENGMARFFRRHAEGVFDLEDVERRADELAGFVAAAERHYRMAKPTALGFSNGANIAVATMLRHPGIFAGAALLRAQPTISVEPLPDLTGVPVLLLAGAMDPLIPETEARRLGAMLAGAGANLTLEIVPAGHNLSQRDLDLLKNWFEQAMPAR